MSENGSLTALNDEATVQPTSSRLETVTTEAPAVKRRPGFPAVSVVIPAYNEEFGLGAVVQS